LEGKAQYRLDPTSDWFDAIDAQPIEERWSVRTLAVSRAVLHFPDGSRVHLRPNTEVIVESFRYVEGGPPIGERHVRLRLIDGNVDFDVVEAESPPNTWVFATIDGAVAIQGTAGSLGRRVSLEEESGDSVLVRDFALSIIEGDATLARVGIDEETGEEIAQVVTVSEGTAFSTIEAVPIPDEFDPVVEIATEESATGSSYATTIVDVEVLIGFSALGVDLGFARSAASQLSTAADAASAGGASGFLVFPKIGESFDFADGTDSSDHAELVGVMTGLAIGGQASVDSLEAGSSIEEVLDDIYGRMDDTSGFQISRATSDDFPLDVGDLLETEVFSGTIDQFQADPVSGEVPTLDGAAFVHESKFWRPSPTGIFDEDGVQVGQKQPDEIVYDSDGNPIGKTFGDFIGTDSGGNADGSIPPEFFFVENPFGKDELEFTTYFNAFMPKAPGASSDLSESAIEVISHVTIGSDGELTPTIIQFDQDGLPTGSFPLSDNVFNAAGDSSAAPQNPFIDLDANGEVTGVLSIPFITTGSNGEQHENSLPSPVAFDGSGEILGLMEPCVIALDDEGHVTGIEVGDLLDADFFVEIARDVDSQLNDGGHGIGVGRLTFEGELVDRSLATIDETDQIVFDAEGEAQTVYEMRPNEVFRDSDTGDISGSRPFTEVTCVTQDCFAVAVSDNSVLSGIEETLQVLAHDGGGGKQLMDTSGTALFTESGRMAGFSPPAVAIVGSNDEATTFVVTGLTVFTVEEQGSASDRVTPGQQPLFHIDNTEINEDFELATYTSDGEKTGASIFVPSELHSSGVFSSIGLTQSGDDELFELPGADTRPGGETDIGTGSHQVVSFQIPEFAGAFDSDSQQVIDVQTSSFDPVVEFGGRQGSSTEGASGSPDGEVAFAGAFGSFETTSNTGGTFFSDRDQERHDDRDAGAELFEAKNDVFHLAIENEIVDSEDGWRQCTAATPSAESAQSVDNDCNSDIDDGVPGQGGGSFGLPFEISIDPDSGDSIFGDGSSGSGPTDDLGSLFDDLTDAFDAAEDRGLGGTCDGRHQDCDPREPPGTHEPCAGTACETQEPTDTHEPCTGTACETREPAGTHEPCTGTACETQEPTGTHEPCTGTACETREPAGTHEPCTGTACETQEPTGTHEPCTGTACETQEPGGTHDGGDGDGTDGGDFPDGGDGGGSQPPPGGDGTDGGDFPDGGDGGGNQPPPGGDHTDGGDGTDGGDFPDGGDGGGTQPPPGDDGGGNQPPPGGDGGGNQPPPGGDGGGNHQPPP
jgi:hypothetical protein